MTCRYKTILNIIMSVCALCAASHVMASIQSHPKSTVSKNDSASQIVSNEKTNPVSNDEPVYANTTASTRDIERLVNALAYDETTFPGSQESFTQWETITDALNHLNILASPDSDKPVSEAFINYRKENESTFHTALANIAFVMNTYPENDHFWKQRAIDEFSNLLVTLKKYHQATTDIEDTAFGHTPQSRAGHGEDYLRALFITLQRHDITWISTARLTHFILLYFNSYASKNEPQIHDRNPVKTIPIAKRFLAKEHHVELAKQTLKAIIKRLNYLELPYWRYKAMEYTAALLYTLELDYKLPVTDEWLNESDKAILSKNARLVDWALAVEGMCPSIGRAVGISSTCSTPPRKPQEASIITTVNTWHKSHIHSIDLFPTVAAMYLARRLAAFGHLSDEELILSWASEPSIEEFRSLSELKVRAIKQLGNITPH